MIPDWAVRQARWMFASGNFSQAQLEKHFGVSEMLMCHILNRSLFKHLY